MTESRSLTPRRPQVERVLRRETPERILYAPNYWQWFAHQQNHGRLPPELAHCRTQLDLIRHLGLDVFSRNIYSDQRSVWFGGLAEAVWDGVEFAETQRTEPNGDILFEKTFRTRAGTLTERQRYVFADSTLVQEKFLLDDYAQQMDAFEALVAGRRWRFHPERYDAIQRAVGDDGLVNAGELFSPLKLLHFTAGADNAVFLLDDFPERCAEIMRLHEEAQIDLVRQMTAARVPAMMAMDNLDTMFHTPAYVERCSAGFYERASRLCHEAGAAFFIHACGRQRATLPLIASLGVDGLEGVAYPPLGDVQLDEAMELSGGRFLITGGISAMETEKFQTADEVRRYVEDLFRRLRPHAHRFVFAASCNTSIRTPWKVIQWFRDAWKEFC